MRKGLPKYPSLLTVLLFFLVWVKPPSAIAQTLKQTKPNFWNSNWELTLNVGGNQFYGDVNNRNFFQKWSQESPLGYQLNLTKMLHSYWGVGINLNYAGVKSIKDQLPDGTRVDFSLTGKYFGVNPYFYLNFNDLIFGYKADRSWALYGKIGVGYAFWNNTLTNNITGTSVKSGETVGAHTYAKKGLEVPLTAGLRFRLSARLSLDLGAEYTTILSDDVDLWNEGYKYDKFLYTHAGITYSFGSSHRSRKPEKEREPKADTRTKQNIPLFDYTFFSSPDKSLQQASQPVVPPADVLKIDQPVSPPTATQTTTQKATQQQTAAVQQHRGLEFRVQIMAADKKMGVAAVQAKYNLSVPVEEVYQNGYYRYTVGHYSSYQAALAESRQIRAQGITDAFVTAYREGLRIPLTSSMMH
ncbi:MAG: hypothetical protein JXR71_01810 [Bacteroidales bacterium]|nr:hypothetical protein [Bacteroidales bacterium]